MKSNYLSYGKRLFIALATVVTGFGARAQSAAVAATPTPKQQAMLQQQALLFMENKGQVKNHLGQSASNVLFTARNAGAQLFVTSTGINYQFTKVEKKSPIIKADNLTRTAGKAETHRFTVSLQGSNPHPQVVAEKQSAYTETYLNAGNNVSGVRSFEQVTLKNVYTGIDWVIYNKNGFMEYDFIVHPGADAAQIKLKVTDADGVEITQSGSLKIKTRLGEVTEKAPVSFDDAGNKLATSFKKNTDGSLGFAVTNAPKGKRLRIDPEVVWATYYGGSSFDFAEACAVDLNGNVYLRGYTTSTNNIASGGYQLTSMGDNGFVAKFNSAGQRLWGTYTESTYALFTQIAVDAVGNVYVTGETTDEFNFGATVNQTTYGGGGQDAYIMKVNSNGSLGWKTYYGGDGDDYGKSCSVDASGNVYLTGYTNSTNNIATSGAFKTTLTPNEFDFYDAYLVKFSNSGTRLWGTYLGGTGYDQGESCSVDASGNVYVAGTTSSTNGIAYNGFKNTVSNYLNGFLVKFNGSGQRQWGTYYGSNDSGDTVVHAVTTDIAGNVFIAGRTDAWTGIAFNGHQNSGGYGSIGGEPTGSDGYLAKFSASGVREWATYYGTNEYDDWAMACRADLQGNIYLAGFSQDGFGEVTMPSKAFIIKYNSAGKYIWDEAYQGNEGSSGYGMAADATGNVYICGSTGSSTGIASGGFQNTIGGDSDGFLIKIDGSGSYNCTEPKTLTANVTSATEASVSWAAPGTGTPEGYEYAVTTNDEAPESGTATNNLTANVSGLAAGQYYLYVRAVCAPERYSEWAVLQFCAVTAPAASAQELCGSDTVADLEATGDNLKWYVQAEGGAALSSSQAVVMGTYYATQTIGGCESARTAVAVTVIPARRYYADADGDGFGNPEIYELACAKPVGYAENPNDCDDNNNEIQQCPDAAFTKLTAEFCNATVVAMSTMVYADAVTGASAYRFRVSTNASDEVVVEKSVRWFRFNEVAGVRFATNYIVEVAVFADGEWQPYGEACTVATPAFPVTQVSAAHCGSTVSSFNAIIYADGVASASSYRFRVTDGITTSVIIKASRYFKINEITGYTYNSTYTIDVAAQINGVWGQYGNSCTVSTMDAPGSRILTEYCGVTVPSLRAVLYAELVPLATQYLFRITSGGTTVIVPKATRYLMINEIPDYAYAKTYNISVAVQIDGTYGSFGPSCTVSTPAAPTTSVVATQCGGTVGSLSEKIVIAPVQLAQGYRIRLTNGPQVQIIDRPYNDFKLNMFASYAYNVGYTVEIAVMLNGSYGGYGPACTVTAVNGTGRPGTGITVAVDTNAVPGSNNFINLTSYPNPYTDSFVIEMQTESQAKVTVRVFDMNGRMVEDVTVAAEKLTSQKLGGNFASGIYNVIVTQGDYQKAFKVVKK